MHMGEREREREGERKEVWEQEESSRDRSRISELGTEQHHMARSAKSRRVPARVEMLRCETRSQLAALRSQAVTSPFDLFLRDVEGSRWSLA